MRITLILLLVLSLASCRNRSKIVTVTETNTVITERIDTVVVIKGDSLRDVLPLSPIDFTKGFTHKIEKDIATVNITFNPETNELTTDVVIPDKEVEVEMERKTEVNERKRDVVRTVERPKRPWWHTLLLCAFFFAFGYFACSVRKL